MSSCSMTGNCLFSNFISNSRYLTYRLQLVKLQKNAKNRNRRVWWIFVHVIMREDYTQLFDGKFEKFLTELHDTVMTMLHDEYTRLSNKKK